MLKSCNNPSLVEAGCDEAGRGCLAGAVFAAAVIFPPDYKHPEIQDSKKVSPSKREDLREVIKKDAIAWAVSKVDVAEIDKINILAASIKAINIAVNSLNLKPEFLLVDGNRFTDFLDIPYKCIVKGDAKFLSIAAASILAKTYRDDYMLEIAKKYPQYLWHKNKGYPTAEHRKAILKYGITPYHRKSFALLPKQLSFEFKY